MYFLLLHFLEYHQQQQTNIYYTGNNSVKDIWSIIPAIKENNKPIVYITIMNNISVDCDCDAHQGDPVMGDLGIVASLDPVANDQAFIDMLYRKKRSKIIKDISFGNALSYFGE